MYFPTELFRYINEFNGVNDYFPKKLINLLRYTSCDDLEIILKNVLNITYRFNHKQLSTERRKILLKLLFNKPNCKNIFIQLLDHYEMMKNIFSFHNYGFKVGDEVFWIKGYNSYCGIISKINQKSIKLNCYDFEIKTAENWDRRQVQFKYWIKNIFKKHISITNIDNVYKNDPRDTDINRENFIRIRQY